MTNIIEGLKKSLAAMQEDRLVLLKAISRNQEQVTRVEQELEMLDASIVEHQQAIATLEAKREPYRPQL